MRTLSQIPMVRRSECDLDHIHVARFTAQACPISPNRLSESAGAARELLRICTLLKRAPSPRHGTIGTDHRERSERSVARHLDVPAVGRRDSLDDRQAKTTRARTAREPRRKQLVRVKSETSTIVRNAQLASRRGAYPTDSNVRIAHSRSG